MKQVYDLDQGKPFDCTTVGFDIFWARGGRVIAIGRNRWQGSRDNVKLTLTERMTYEKALEDSEALSESASFAFGNLVYNGNLKRGNVCDGWKVTSTGFIVE